MSAPQKHHVNRVEERPDGLLVHAVVIGVLPVRFSSDVVQRIRKDDVNSLGEVLPNRIRLPVGERVEGLCIVRHVLQELLL